MFKDTINATMLKNYGDDLANLSGTDAVQVLHRGAEVKVIITQEYFFHLLGAAHMAFPSEAQPVSVNRAEAKARAKSLVKEKNEKTNGEPKSDQSA